MPNSLTTLNSAYTNLHTDCYFFFAWYAFWCSIKSTKDCSIPEKMLLVLPVIIHLTSQQKDEDGENLGYKLVFWAYSVTPPLSASVYPVSGNGSWKTCRSKTFPSDIKSTLVILQVPSISTVLCDQGTLEFLAEMPWAWQHPGGILHVPGKVGANINLPVKSTTQGPKQLRNKNYMGNLNFCLFKIING